MSDEISTANIRRLGDEEKVFVSDLIKQVGKMEVTLKPWRSNLVKYYELYKMYQRTKHYDGLAQLFIPEVLRAVETIVSNMYRILFQSDPWMEYAGRTDEEQEAAEAATDLVYFQMEENKFKMKIQDSLRQLAITGITVRKVLWDFHQVPKTKRKYYYETIIDDATGQAKQVKQQKTVDDLETVRDHWTIEAVDLLGFYISDVRTPYYDIQKADWIGEEYQVDPSWLKRHIKKNWLSDVNEDYIKPANQNMASDAERLKNDLLQTSGYKQNVEKDRVLIYEQWGLLEAKYVYSPEELDQKQLEPDDLVESVVMIANREYLVKLAPNPYWHGKKPYISCPYIPQEGEFAGMGAAQISQSLQEELNDTRNQTMDNKTLILMCMWLKNRASGIKNQDLRVRPLGVIGTNDMNGLQALRPPVLTGVGVNIEGVIKNDLRESVGAPSNLQGIAQSGVSTATESTQINAQAMGRLLLSSQLYSELMIKPMLIMADALNEQFYTEEKVIRVVGAKGIHWKKLSPENIWSEIQKDVIVKLSTDLDESPGVKRQQALQFLTIIEQIPPQMLPFYWKFLDKLYKMFFPNGHDLTDVFPAPPEDTPSLDPNDENEILAMEKSVSVNPNDDDAEHLKSHEPMYNNVKFGLSTEGHERFTKHILDHYKQLNQKQQAQAQQAQAMQMMSEQAGGNTQALNPGQTPGMTPFTQPNVSKPGDLTRNMGV